VIQTALTAQHSGVLCAVHTVPRWLQQCTVCPQPCIERPKQGGPGYMQHGGGTQEAVVVPQDGLKFPVLHVWPSLKNTQQLLQTCHEALSDSLGVVAACSLADGYRRFRIVAAAPSMNCSHAASSSRLLSRLEQRSYFRSRRTRFESRRQWRFLHLLHSVLPSKVQHVKTSVKGLRVANLLAHAHVLATVTVKGLLACETRIKHENEKCANED
jgi:hypothetical protein